MTAIVSRDRCTSWLGYVFEQLSFLGFLGCASSDQSSAPSSIDAAAVASRAVEAYDVNSDGKLEKDELAKCPALMSAARRMDANRDGALDKEELTARLQSYSSLPGEVRPEVFLMRDGNPMVDAAVIFEPEEFMGENLQSYRGTAGSFGSAGLEGTEDESYFLKPGFYRVTITPPGGSEQVEGCEIASDVPNIARMTFKVR